MKWITISLFLILFLCGWSPAKADVISNIVFAPGPCCAMQTGNYVQVTFDYNVSTPGGVRIFPRPFTHGALTPGYAASGSSVYTGMGTASSSFTITTGTVTVDSVRFTVTNADQSQTILVFYVPVEYHFGANGVYNIQVSPDWPTSLEFGHNVAIHFDYTVSTPGGIRIFPRPFTNGALTPGYGASASPVYTGTGSETGDSFTISSGTVKVDQVRFRITNSDQSMILDEFFVPVDYLFSTNAISDVVITPSSPEGLLNGDNVNLSFSYYTTEASGARIFARPFTNGSLTPNYGAHGSPNYPTGSGSGSGWFTITSGAVNVDSIRLEMLDNAQTKTLLEYFVPVNFFFSSAKMSNISFHPPSPAYFTNGEYDTTRFTYTHSNAAGALMWSIPYTAGSPSPQFSYQGSPTHPSGSASLTRDFSITSGSVKVDAANLHMTNPDQSSIFIDWLVPVEFSFGSQSLVSVEEVPEAPARYALEQNFPNPFNPGTVVSGQWPVASVVRLAVYDLLGREVAVLAAGWYPAGKYSFTFDGSTLASGVYFYRLQAGQFVDTKQMLLLK